MSKLYRHATSEFGLPVYVDFSGEVSLLPAGGLPLMYWPDGRWCFEASLFMGHLARQGLSRRYRGGTLLSRPCKTQPAPINTGFALFPRQLHPPRINSPAIDF